MAARFLNRLIRRKFVNYERLGESELSRCLTTVDLVALGIGSTLGAGAYVITGQVAKNDAGPAVVLSFLIAAVAAILAGLCYAEFGARVPQAGSAYVYTYVTVGEVMAFVVGWNLLLEYVIGSAACARAFSGYVDFLVGNKIRPWLIATMPMDVHGLAKYFDPIALVVMLLITVLLCVGVKESSTFNKVFTAVNVLIISGTIISGAFKDNPENWSLNATNQTHCGGDEHQSCGAGGFAPYGIAGITKGAATAFFAYIGFDAITTTGEEVINPQRAIPVSIVLSLLVICLAYCGLSVTVTMMSPYYALSIDAPFAKIFQDVGWPAATYVVTVGAICALSTSLLGGMFPMPRVLYAMAKDGLVFRSLGYVSERFKTPLIATVLSGVLGALLAAVFDVDALVNMLSIGTLLAFNLVAISVLLLRYEPAAEEPSIPNPPGTGLREILSELFKPTSYTPTQLSHKCSRILVLLIVTEILACSVLLTFAKPQLWLFIVTGILVGAIVLEAILLRLQPQSNKSLTFKVPFLPFLPVASVFINIYLMIQLDHLTWIRFVVWLTIGFLIYFGYGMFNSNEERRGRLSSQQSEGTENKAYEKDPDHIGTDPNRTQ